MAVKRIQTEETYFVSDDEQEYVVTIITDLQNLYIQYDVFDEEGDEVTNKSKILELIEQIESSTV